MWALDKRNLGLKSLQNETMLWGKRYYTLVVSPQIRAEHSGATVLRELPEGLR